MDNSFKTIVKPAKIFFTFFQFILFPHSTFIIYYVSHTTLTQRGLMLGTTLPGFRGCNRP